MRTTAALQWGVVLVMACSLPPAMAQDRVRIVDPAAPEIAGLFVLTAAEAQLGGDGEARWLDVRFRHDHDWPNIRFNHGTAFDRADWSPYAVLVLRLQNTGEVPLRVNVRVDDDAAADGNRHCRQGGVELEPGRIADLRFDLSLPKIDGMRGQPRGRGLDKGQGDWIRDNGRPLDTSRITAFQIFLAKPDRDHALRLHDIWLDPLEAVGRMQPFVDRYGQFTDENWPGKLYNDAEFPARLAAEAADLAANPALADRNRFGGWEAGPQLEATGRFRVAKYGGQWWFVDPDGRLFWSSGITGLRAESAGPIQGREFCFSWLPEEDEPLGRFYNRRGRGMLDFYRMNLFRKYGEGFLEHFATSSLERLISWGFNTVANWSDPEVWNLRRVPYTIPIHYSCPRLAIWTDRSFPDVFDEEFESAVRNALLRVAAHRDDPWLLGVFIDNELPWASYAAGGTYTLPITVLKSEQPTRMREVLVRDLQRAYDTVEKLNAAWGVEVAEWGALVAHGVDLNREQQERAQPDLAAMSDRLARQYFLVCRRLMGEVLPGCLYLGPRFSSWNRETVLVAREHCDVVCFNIYADLPTDGSRGEFLREQDMPVVIGEFHFGALDRGMFHTGLRRAVDQNDRAAKFAAYMRTAVAEPWCVGAHWFQFRDQPLTGRFDGENYNIGFVTITDTPYPELVVAARTFNRELYARRTGAAVGAPGR